ncbi:hypothetical protein T06_2807 [Trichinella sp. T6]|nr:hypothetical protein T06_2807 [Trichinella sp. T6]
MYRIVRKRWARLDANVATAEHFDIGRSESFFTNVQRGNLQQQQQREMLKLNLA